MTEEKKRKNKIIGISLGITIVLLVIISSTYAYWTITRSQNKSNDIIAACLDIRMDEQVGTLTPSKNYPISDVQGLDDAGFTFTVFNYCEEDVAYVIGLDSVEINYDTTKQDGYMRDSSIKVSIDDTEPRLFSELEPIDHIDDNEYVIRNSKKINTAVVPGKTGDTPGKDTHTIKAWIDEDAPLDDNNKVFGTRVFITGGQFIENDSPIVAGTEESCFDISDSGEITAYHYGETGCGDDVAVPKTIKGIEVKSIDSDAFKANMPKEVYYGSDIQTVSQSTEKINKVDSIDTSEATLAYIFDNYVEDTKVDLNLESIIANSKYIVKLTPDAPVNATVDGAGQQYGISEKIKNYDEIPELEVGQVMIYANIDASFDGNTIGAKYLKNEYLVSIKGLDLSAATNLEKIEEYAFTNLPKSNIDNLEDYPVSLTSLNFGNNKEIVFGHASFARIDVPELTLYTTYSFEDVTVTEGDVFKGVFGGTIVDKLIYKPGTDTIIQSKPFTITLSDTGESVNMNERFHIRMYFDELVVSEGITEIRDRAFYGEYTNIPYTGKKATLPNSLTTIGLEAFHNYPFDEVIIGSGITSIGEGAFNGMSSNQTIKINMTEADFNSKVNPPAGWADDAILQFK